MKKFLLSLVLVAISSFSYASDVISEGSLNLPAQLKVVSDTGEIKYLETTRLGSRFTMRSDNSISMAQGLTTSCGSFLGKTAEDQRLNAVIAERYTLGRYDIKAGVFDKLPVVGTGTVVIVVPAGANVWGACADGTSDLVQMTLQYSLPNEPRNLFDRTFVIEPLQGQ